MGDITLVRRYKDENNFSKGYVYNLKKGASWRIPLPPNGSENKRRPPAISCAFDRRGAFSHPNRSPPSPFPQENRNPCRNCNVSTVPSIGQAAGISLYLPMVNKPFRPPGRLVVGLLLPLRSTSDPLPSAEGLANLVCTAEVPFLRGGFKMLQSPYFPCFLFHFLYSR